LIFVTIHVVSPLTKQLLAARRFAAWASRWERERNGGIQPWIHHIRRQGKEASVATCRYERKVLKPNGFAILRSGWGAATGDDLEPLPQHIRPPQLTLLRSWPDRAGHAPTAPARMRVDGKTFGQSRSSPSRYPLNLDSREHSERL